MQTRAKRTRRRNYNEPGDAHELTFSCYHGFQFLKAERTCLWLAEAIDEARKALQFDLWAFVLMPEHAHLVIHPHEHVYDIAKIRKAIKGPVVVESARPQLKRDTGGWGGHRGGWWSSPRDPS